MGLHAPRRLRRGRSGRGSRGGSGDGARRKTPLALPTAMTTRGLVGEGFQLLVVRRKFGVLAVRHCTLVGQSLGPVEMAVYPNRFAVVGLGPLVQQRAEDEQADKVTRCPEQP